MKRGSIVVAVVAALIIAVVIVGLAIHQVRANRRARFEAALIAGKEAMDREDWGAARTALDTALAVPGYQDHAEAVALSNEVDAIKPRLTITLKKLDKIVIADLKLVLVPIKAGKFLMGSPATEKARFDNELRHEVTITKPYWLGTTEVTPAQYEAVMGSNPSYFKGNDLPVEQVTWDDAVVFCKKLTERERKAGRLPEGQVYRLPTEAEWESACRAGTQTVFHYGDRLDASQANFDGNYPYGNGRKGEYRHKTLAVGSFKPNAWGLFDMHGNVWEWCHDWYGDYPRGAARDPTGPERGSHRVNRGGGWYNYAWDCRSALRRRNAPAYRNRCLGFRLASGIPVP